MKSIYVLWKNKSNILTIFTLLLSYIFTLTTIKQQEEIKCILTLVTDL